jgi:ESF2/ABP1 family protein
MEAGDGQQEGKRKERRSKFAQREMRTKADKKPEPGQDVQKILGSIF